MVDFDFNSYEPDVQRYIRSEWDASNIIMHKGDVYVNWQGKSFTVLEDSPKGEAHVKCKCLDKFGIYEGYRPKVVLVS